MPPKPIPADATPMTLYQAILTELQTSARNAARRNKPVQWAYFVEVEQGLRAWFADTTPSDGGYAGRALALTQKAQAQCPTLPPAEAARLWALGVYARRILRAWGVPEPKRDRPSLTWLRERAERELARAA